MRRVQYLENALTSSKSENLQEYSDALLLFSLFIEHVSLFSQFLIIMAFNKHRNLLKGVSNVVEATSKEEQIHGDFGIDLIKIIQKKTRLGLMKIMPIELRTCVYRLTSLKVKLLIGSMKKAI